VKITTKQQRELEEATRRARLEMEALLGTTERASGDEEPLPENELEVLRLFRRKCQRALDAALSGTGTGRNASDFASTLSKIDNQIRELERILPPTHEYSPEQAWAEIMAYLRHLEPGDGLFEQLEALVARKSPRAAGGRPA